MQSKATHINLGLLIKRRHRCRNSSRLLFGMAVHFDSKYLTIVQIYANYGASFSQINLEKCSGLLYELRHSTKADIK